MVTLRTSVLDDNDKIAIFDKKTGKMLDFSDGKKLRTISINIANK
jgi:hypothetical protein